MLDSIKKQFPKESLRQASLCFLLKENQILLAMKKRGFAAGKWNGVGGKFSETDQTIETTARRETYEEIKVKPRKIKRVAVLNFYFKNRDDWNQQVHVFETQEWTGTPTETEEMAPKWFAINEIPYDKMWEDDSLWLPKVLLGHIVEGDFLFDENQKMTEYDVREIT